MTYKVIVLPEAEVDILAARDWYEERRERLGDDFVARVKESLQSVGRAPFSHASQLRGVRAAMTPRFPYVMYYRIEESRVIVFAVMHSARDPEAWRSRDRKGD